MGTIVWTIGLYRGRGTQDKPRQFRSIQTADLVSTVERKGKTLYTRHRSEYGDWAVGSVTKQHEDGQLFIYYNSSRGPGNIRHISQALVDLIPEVPEPIYVP